MPVIGDSMTATRVKPSASAAAATSATTRACTAGSRTSPPLPTSFAPGLELGLHKRDDVGARPQERRQRPGECGAAR